jgi:hypothetical protein
MAMRAVIFVTGIFLLLSTSAAAQGPAGVGSGPGYFSTGAHEENKWNIAVGYQYNRDNLLGSPFNTSGLNVSAARFFDRWFAIEAQLGAGLSGNTGQSSAPPNLTVKSIFAGAGPRVAYRTQSRYEPWVHLLVGIQHYRFSQTAGALGSNSSVAGTGGGGLDVYLNPHVAIRAGADEIFTEFFSSNQRSFQVVGGVVFGF